MSIIGIYILHVMSISSNSFHVLTYMAALYSKLFLRHIICSLIQYFSEERTDRGKSLKGIKVVKLGSGA
jgi:hypothetical protein